MQDENSTITLETSLLIAKIQCSSALVQPDAYVLASSKEFQDRFDDKHGEDGSQYGRSSAKEFADLAVSILLAHFWKPHLEFLQISQKQLFLLYHFRTLKTKYSLQ